MPLKIPDNLPAAEVLEKENIFIMKETRALSQDIRPLKIGILNLMPRKIATEIQLLRLLGNSPLQIDVTLVRPETHKPKNVSLEYLETFYKTIDDIKREKFDGFIITGAPIENIPFEEVNYWDELTEIIDWTKKNVTSTMYICWGAQAGLYHNYGIEKHKLDKKLFGVFSHKLLKKDLMLVKGFDDEFFIPHSRHTTVYREDIEKHKELEIVAESDEAGVFMIISSDCREVYLTGHAEYDADTLKFEYERDLKKNEPIEIPKNYFPNDDPSKEPVQRWRAHANLLAANWLNFIYQKTPYVLEMINYEGENKI